MTPGLRPRKPKRYFSPVKKHVQRRLHTHEPAITKNWQQTRNRGRKLLKVLKFGGPAATVIKFLADDGDLACGRGEKCG